MADPALIFPYHDPFDETPFAENVFLMLDENPNLGLAESPSTEPNYFSHSIPQSGDYTAELNDPLADPIVWGTFNPTTSNSQAGPSEFRGETSHRQEIPQPQNLDFGNPVQLSIWPVPPVPYSCTCCQVLREIIHTNGIHVTKLEIHGRLGLICHAILENRYGGDWTIQNQFQMFDFCKKSIEAVREFLFQYCENHKQAGYTMLQDPLRMFYEALCVGLIGDDGQDTDGFLQPSPADSGEYQMNHPEAMNQPWDESEEVRLPKNSLAAQRERTGKLTLNDLVGYFHLPIDDAAKKMNVCPTVMKKICRRHGLLRWPYRKIKSIEKKISTKRASLTASDAEERASAQADIERLEQELASIFAAFNH